MVGGDWRPMLTIRPYTEENMARGGWNKGLTILTDKRVASNSASAIRGRTIKLSQMTPDERRLAFTRQGMKGGPRHGAGRGNKGWFRPIGPHYWCDSSWELAWCIYALDNGLLFTRNHQGFDYTFEGKSHKFYPDFRLTDGTYVEIKGWMTEQTYAKIAQFPEHLEVLDEPRMKPILELVIRRYGPDFTRFYDGGKAGSRTRFSRVSV